jgi:hypothetical protein
MNDDDLDLDLDLDAADDAHDFVTRAECRAMLDEALARFARSLLDAAGAIREEAKDALDS